MAKRHAHTSPLPPLTDADAPPLDPRPPAIDAIATKLLASSLDAAQIEAIGFHVDGIIKNASHRSAMMRR